VTATPDAADTQAWLVDEDGVVIAHTRPERVFQSPGPLTADAVKRIDPQERFRRDDVPSWNVPELAELHHQPTSGLVTYTDATAGRRRAAYSPLTERPWCVAVDGDARALGEASRSLVWRELLPAALIALLLAAVLLLRRRFGPRAG
jgi:C4-dicarboxylate-specific signal transduction histidine kinase